MRHHYWVYRGDGAKAFCLGEAEESSTRRVWIGVVNALSVTRWRRRHQGNHSRPEASH